MPTAPMLIEPSRRQAVETVDASEPGVDLVLRRSEPISRPIDIVRALKSFGLGLADAHRALNRIVADEAARLSLGNADRATMIAELAEFGVAAD